MQRSTTGVPKKRAAGGQYSLPAFCSSSWYMKSVQTLQRQAADCSTDHSTPFDYLLQAFFWHCSGRSMVFFCSSRVQQFPLPSYLGDPKPAGPPNASGLLRKWGCQMSILMTHTSLITSPTCPARRRVSEWEHQLKHVETFEWRNTNYWGELPASSNQMWMQLKATINWYHLEVLIPFGETCAE